MNTMNAVTVNGYGSPAVFQMINMPKPTPKDNEVLIRIRAAIAGPADCAFRKGDPFIVKLMYGLWKPKFPILGVELSGEIEAIGKDVTRFKVGDQVYGITESTFGAYAEYKCLSENGVIALKSPRMSFEDAAGILDGAMTSLIFMRDVAKVQRGQKVLINGASGSVGAYGVQIAKLLGAEVTGVCGPSNVALVKSLGADHVIDYTKQDFTTTGPYDVIYDAVGKKNFSSCKKALTSQGMYLTTVPTLAIVFDMLFTARSKGKTAKFVASGLQQKVENVETLTKMFEDGKLRPVIDRCYPLAQLAEAHTYVDTGHKKGNVVIVVA